MESRTGMSGVRRSATLLVMAAALGIATPADAQLATVEASPMQANSWLTQMNTYLQQLQAYTEYGLQANRWYQTYQHYQQQLVRMNGIIKRFGLPTGRRLEAVDESHMVAERCGGGLSVRNVLGAVVPQGSGDLIAQQRQTCVYMQQIQNLQYNETVAFINKTMPELERQLATIRAQRQADNNNGTVDASAQAAVQTLADMQADAQALQARMDSYDSLLTQLKRAQQQLARRALDGESGPIGTVVKTATLKAALEAGRGREDMDRGR